jgi:RNA polymerase sigma-70 factor, ECF subfamily
VTPGTTEGGGLTPDSARVAAHDAAARAVRGSFGRLVAILAAPTRDLALAEDAVAGAAEQALRTWPESGVPRNPEGWLLAVARNRMLDALKSAARRTAVPLEDEAAVAELRAIDPDAVPDRRLALLLVCAHPAIDPGVRTPLMLQAVLGVDAVRIAEAFAVPAAAMAQRLVRAKRRIRDAGIPFEEPDRSVLPARLPAVLEAVYGAYAVGHGVVAGRQQPESLAGEALHLGLTLAELLPDEPEVLGLAALIALALARAPARRADRYVPLQEQDPALWDAALLDRGEALLEQAGRLRRPGRFQLEAAIQAVHAARRHTGATDWAALEQLYRRLVAVAPTLGARVAAATVSGRVRGPDAGLAALDAIGEHTARFQPAWAARAHLLEEAGRFDAAVQAYERALHLTTDRQARAYLAERLAALQQGSASGEALEPGERLGAAEHGE